MRLGFTDATGYEWPFRRITLADYDDLAAVGLDVEAVSEDLGKLADLIQNRRKFAAVLWWFVGAAVEAAKLTPREFHARLDGDVMHAAAIAVRDAVIDFFPYPAAVKAKLIGRLTAGQGTEEAPDGCDAAPTNTPPSPAGSTPEG